MQQKIQQLSELQKTHEQLKQESEQINEALKKDIREFMKEAKSVKSFIDVTQNELVPGPNFVSSTLQYADPVSDEVNFAQIAKVSYDKSEDEVAIEVVAPVADSWGRKIVWLYQVIDVDTLVQFIKDYWDYKPKNKK